MERLVSKRGLNFSTFDNGGKMIEVFLLFFLCVIEYMDLNFAYFTVKLFTIVQVSDL